MKYFCLKSEMFHIAEKMCGNINKSRVFVRGLSQVTHFLMHEIKEVNL